MSRFEDVTPEYLKNELQFSEEAVEFLNTRENQELLQAYQERSQDIKAELESRQSK